MTERHRIESISYRKDVVVCTCGKKMTAKDGEDWNYHRRQVATAQTEKRGRNDAQRRWNTSIASPPDTLTGRR